MATAVDVGEWNEIHPKDKKTVGKRLALAAQAIAYQQPVSYQNPQLQSIDIQNNKLVLSIEHLKGKPLIKGKLSRSFAIASEDGHFIWAKAKVIGDKIAIWYPDKPNPTVVRYAWANNPNTPIYNNDGLPLLPFSYQLVKGKKALDRLDKGNRGSVANISL